MPLIFCVAIVAVPLLQLVPLPPSIWTALPHRTAEAETFQLLGRSLPWRPLSMSPEATWSSLLALTVPLAVFLSVIQLNAHERRWLTLMLVAFSALAVVLGLSQLALGRNGAIRLFDITNESEATGFFANRNHFAALLYCAFLFAAVWAIEIVRKSEPASGRGLLCPGTVAIIVIATVLVALIAGQAMARSRAGIGLGIAAIVIAGAIAIVDRRRGSHVSLTHVLLGVVLLGVVLIGQFALFRIVQRFGSDPFDDARLVIGGSTFNAALDLLPAGAGLGTFVPVFALYERTTDLLPNLFANRAHNDWLEFLLETGAFAIVIIGAFLVWFGLKAASAWRWTLRTEEASIDVALRRAAIAVIALLLIHSFVDYPLRTAAMGAVFALACAFAAIPTKSIARRSLRHATQVRYASERDNTKKLWAIT